MDIMDNIKKNQAKVKAAMEGTFPVHKPEMLYIGCVDARLDPIDDIGIEKGKALIFRNIGALVRKSEAQSNNGEAPQNVSIGAVLEFFLNHIDPGTGKIKRIVISGHTDCGGIKACWLQGCKEHDHYLPLYLDNFNEARKRVMAQAKEQGLDQVEVLRSFEKEAVRQSVENLLTYDVVRKKIEEGVLEVYGWVIDTATQRISVMNPKTQLFEPMDV